MCCFDNVYIGVRTPVTTMKITTQTKHHNDVNDLSAPVGRSRPAENSRCSRSSPSETLINCKLRTKHCHEKADTVTVGTWNVRTLWQTGKLELMKRELSRMRYDIVGISEVRWTGSGELMNGRMVFAGEERKHEKGVAIVINWIPLYQPESDGCTPR